MPLRGNRKAHQSKKGEAVPASNPIATMTFLERAEYMLNKGQRHVCDACFASLHCRCSVYCLPSSSCLFSSSSSSPLLTLTLLVTKLNSLRSSQE